MVVIGFIGSSLDRVSKNELRWQKWRPTVSICQQEDIIVDKFELLANDSHKDLIDEVTNDIQQISPETTVNVHQANIKDPWDFETVYSYLYDFCQNYTFDYENEEYLVHITTGTHVEQICLFLLIETNFFPAKILQSIPPKVRSPYSVGTYKVIDLDLSKYDGIAARFKESEITSTNLLKDGAKTINVRFNKVISDIEKISNITKAPILIQGPIGVGKSKLAENIYNLKKLKQQVTGDFININCAEANSDSFLPSLLGYRKGSFHGATRNQDGLLAKANKGLIFLNEISALSKDKQEEFIKYLNHKTFYPLSSDEEIFSDFQIIVSSSKDLCHEVRENRFSASLLSIINTWTFSIPGLYQRQEDIEQYVDYELNKYSNEASSKITFNKEAKTKYISFAKSSEAKWTNNFSDLRSSIIRMCTVANNGRINVNIVETEIEYLKQSWLDNQADYSETILLSVLSKDTIDDLDIFDKAQLSMVLQECKGEKSISSASRKIFSNSLKKRKTSNDADRLIKYLAKFGLKWSEIDFTKLP